MKLLHVADLHIGKIVNEFSMLEDQKYILEQILQTAIAQKVDAILIAGDLYDRSIPPADAVAVFDHFLTKALEHQIKMIMIAGNHDSQERVSFLENVLQAQGLFISGVPKEELKTVRFPDAEIVLLPFCKPSQVQCSTSEEAVRKLLSGYWEKEKEQDQKKSRILVTHYFVTVSGREPELSDSESTIHVGSLDNVDASVFEGFDYVALGHLHGPQNIGSNRIRYCGTPLKYSFSECGHHKSVTVVELGAKENLELHLCPLTPRHDMRQLRGTFAELTDKANYSGTATEDYLHIILTDEEDVPEAVGRLRVIYPNLMKLTYDNTRTRTNQVLDKAEDVHLKSPLELFAELYAKQNNQPMSDEQCAFMQELIESIKEGVE